MLCKCTERSHDSRPTAYANALTQDVAHEKKVLEDSFKVLQVGVSENITLENVQRLTNALQNAMTNYDSKYRIVKRAMVPQAKTKATAKGKAGAKRGAKK